MVAERHAAAITTTDATEINTRPGRRHWLAIIVLCLGQLMLTLDATVANVALPAIQADMRFSQSGLAWVVNGYLITFGGLLLLAGRLGDILGRKRVFLAGLAAFTLASLACGAASSPELLIAARCLQGVAAACASAMILGILVTVFSDPTDTAKAMSVYTFVAVSGGTIGLLVGGALTQVLSWHWIFFINLPFGVAALALGALLIPSHQGIGFRHRLDVLGALLVTSAPALAVYTIIQASDHGWSSSRTLGLAAASIALAVIFMLVEGRIRNPLVPLRIFRSRNVVGANITRALFACGLYGLFFLGTLYLQHVQRYGALQTGFAFLPLTTVVAVFSLFITRRVVARVGAKSSLIAGLVLVACGELVFAHAAVNGSYVTTVLPAMLLAGAGGGLAFMPSVSLAMAGAGPNDSGLVSGLANVTIQIGAALGVATVASLSSTHTNDLLSHGHAINDALTSGYDLGLTVAAGCVATGVIVAAIVLRTTTAKPPSRRRRGRQAESEGAITVSAGSGMLAWARAPRSPVAR